MEATEITTTLENVKVKSVSSDQGPLVGIAVVAHPNIVGAAPACVTDGTDVLEVPFRFYKGNMNLVRAELHKLVDDAIEALM